MSLRIEKYVLVLMAATGMLGLSGCKSAFIAATVTNATGGRISEIEVDYPSASFGTSTLEPGGEYHYRFELIGNGPLKVTWTDAAKKPHSATGPSVTEGERGAVAISLQPNGTAVWKPELSH